MELTDIIGYEFKNKKFLEDALTRVAYARENGISSDETMDYLAVLGDAVMDLIVIGKIIDDGVFDKGEITKMKIDSVNMSVFRSLAEKINLPEFVRWGKGEIRMQIWMSGRVSAECFEALMGAVYLDGGVDSAKAVFNRVSGEV
ncbi:MAG: ribonuclease III domain-containing protein [Methanocorpusculum sp.]|nr:ribonuclease III domain-containing protein [Methanocorpusculum sp.]